MSPIILYSGGCRFCRWVVRQLRWLKVDFIPFREPEAQDYMNFLGFADRYDRWHYVDRRGITAWDASTAIAGFFSDQGIHLSGRTIRLLVRVDKWVKDHRYYLSKWVMDGPALMRQDGVDKWIAPSQLSSVPSRKCGGMPPMIGRDNGAK